MPNVIERATAQAAGAWGAIRASVKGLTGVYTRLSEEHKEIAVLLQSASTTSDHDRRVDVWTTVRNELQAHERAKREHVYPWCAAHDELKELVDQCETEAQEIELLIAEVDALSYSSPQWQHAVQRVEQAALLHANNEEQGLFPVAQQVMGTQRALELDGLYINARRSALHELKIPTTDNPADGR